MMIDVDIPPDETEEFVPQDRCGIIRFNKKLFLQLLLPDSILCNQVDINNILIANTKKFDCFAMRKILMRLKICSTLHGIVQSSGFYVLIFSQQFKKKTQLSFLNNQLTVYFGKLVDIIDNCSKFKNDTIMSIFVDIMTKYNVLYSLAQITGYSNIYNEVKPFLEKFLRCDQYRKIIEQTISPESVENMEILIKIKKSGRDNCGCIDKVLVYLINDHFDYINNIDLSEISLTWNSNDFNLHLKYLQRIMNNISMSKHCYTISFITKKNIDRLLQLLKIEIESKAILNIKENIYYIIYSMCKFDVPDIIKPFATEIVMTMTYKAMQSVIPLQCRGFIYEIREYLMPNLEEGIKEKAPTKYSYPSLNDLIYPKNNIPLIMKKLFHNDMDIHFKDNVTQIIMNSMEVISKFLSYGICASDLKRNYLELAVELDSLEFVYTHFILNYNFQLNICKVAEMLIRFALVCKNYDSTPEIITLYRMVLRILRLFLYSYNNLFENFMKSEFASNITEYEEPCIALFDNRPAVQSVTLYDCYKNYKNGSGRLHMYAKCVLDTLFKKKYDQYGHNVIEIFVDLLPDIHTMTKIDATYPMCIHMRYRITELLGNYMSFLLTSIEDNIYTVKKAKINIFIELIAKVSDLKSDFSIKIYCMIVGQIIENMEIILDSYRTGLQQNFVVVEALCYCFYLLTLTLTYDHINCTMTYICRRLKSNLVTDMISFCNCLAADKLQDTCEYCARFIYYITFIIRTLLDDTMPMNNINKRKEVSLSFVDISAFSHWIYKLCGAECVAIHVVDSLTQLFNNDYGLFILQGIIMRKTKTIKNLVANHITKYETFMSEQYKNKYIDNIVSLINCLLAMTRKNSRFSFIDSKSMRCMLSWRDTRKQHPLIRLHDLLQEQSSDVDFQENCEINENKEINSFLRKRRETLKKLDTVIEYLNSLIHLPIPNSNYEHVDVPPSLSIAKMYNIRQLPHACFNFEISDNFLCHQRYIDIEEAKEYCAEKKAKEEKQEFVDQIIE